MKKIVYYFVLIILTFLTGCSTFDDNGINPIDLTPVPLEVDECNVDSSTLIYEDQNVILVNQEELIKLELLATEICSYISETDGSSVGTSRPSYNYWGFKIMTEDIIIGITFYSTDLENTNHHMIVTYTQNGEIIKSVTHYFESQTLTELIQVLEMK